MRLVALSAATAFASLVLLTAARAAAPDADFYTSYSYFGGYQHLTYLTCGATTQAEGCYGSGQLGPFNRVGCFIEGEPNTNGSSVTRAICVVDVDTGIAGAGVTLSRYLKTDTVVSSFDTVAVKLTNTITLPLTGGSNAMCTVAGTSKFFLHRDRSDFFCGSGDERSLERERVARHVSR